MQETWRLLNNGYLLFLGPCMTGQIFHLVTAGAQKPPGPLFPQTLGIGLADPRGGPSAHPSLPRVLRS